MAINKKVLKSKLAIKKIECLTGEEILQTLTKEEKEYIIGCVKNIMSSGQFEAMTENELYDNIVLYIIDSKIYDDFGFFTYCISKQTADFIHRQAELHGIDDGLALESLITLYPEYKE